MGVIIKKYDNGTNYHLQFYCEGCGCAHTINETWQFDENYNKPTINPSVLVTYEKKQGVKDVCHSFIKAGDIQYLGDCTHQYANKTIPLKEIVEGENGFIKMSNDGRH